MSVQKECEVRHSTCKWLPHIGTCAILSSQIVHAVVWLLGMNQTKAIESATDKKSRLFAVRRVQKCQMQLPHVEGEFYLECYAMNWFVFYYSVGCTVPWI